MGLEIGDVGSWVSGVEGGLKEGVNGLLGSCGWDLGLSGSGFYS